MEAASDTAKPWSVTDAKTNFNRLSHLIVECGTRVLQEVFDKIHPPAALTTILASSTVKTQLGKLPKTFYDIIYPAPGTYGKSQDFDITLLCRLLKDLRTLPSPATGWNDEPNEADISLSADVVRLRHKRNELAHSWVKREIQDKDFDAAWKKAKAILTRLAGFVSKSNDAKWTKNIDEMLKAPLTADEERYFKELEKGYLEEIELKQQLGSMDEKMKEIRDICIDIKHSQTKQKGAVINRFDVVQKEREEPSSCRESIDVVSNLLPAAPLEMHIKMKTQDAAQQQRLTKFFLNQYKTEPQTLEQCLKLVLPCGCTLMNVFEGSIVLVIQVSSRNALEDLWNKYKNGQLKDALQTNLITDEIKALVGAQEIAISLEIKEDHYDTAILSLQKLQMQEIRIEMKTQDAALQQGLTKFFLNQYKTEPQKLEQHLMWVLPYGCKLVNVFEGSIVFAIQVSSTNALKDLWNKYKNGQLKDALQTILITDEVKAQVGAQEIVISLEIVEDNFDIAMKNLQKSQLQGVITTSVDISREDSAKPSSSSERIASNLSQQASVAIHINIDTQNEALRQTLTKEILNLYRIEPEKLKQDLLSVLPPGCTLKNVFEGSIVLVIQISSMNALEDLWYRYKNGQLKDALQTILITDEVKARVGAQEIAISLEIEEDNFDIAMKNLQKSQLQEVRPTSSVEVLLDNQNILEKLCLRLDKKMKFVRNWPHLAKQLGIPRKVVKKLELNTDYSPTIRMFDYLQATRPELTIDQLQQALQKIDQNNIIDMIKESGLTRPEETVARTLSNDGRLLDSIALELDIGSGNSYNWRSLGNELGIPRDVLKQFELYTQSPTKLMFRFLKAKMPLLKVHELRKHLSDMKRNDILGIFNEYSIADSAKVADVFKLDSDIFNKVENKLNQDITGVGNWRSLSSRLGICSEIIDNFEEHPMERRPTEQILKWLVGARKRTTVKDVIDALEKIERRDAVVVLRTWLLSINTKIDNNGTMADMGLAALALEPAKAEIEAEETRTQTNPNTRAPVEESTSQHTYKEKCFYAYNDDFPCKVNYFTGRKSEENKVLGKLNDNNYKGVVVVAPYGYGKTTFAAEVAATAIKEGKIIIYVNLRGISSVDDFAFKVIQALGFEPGTDATAEALARLRSLKKDTVLMADNFDEVIHLGMSQVQSRGEKIIELQRINPVSKRKRTCKEDFLDYFKRIKQNCSNVKLFLTSEEKVSFVKFPLWTIELKPLSVTESGELLQKLCTFRSTEEAEALGQICDGIPMKLCNIVSTIQSEGYKATKEKLSEYIQRLSSSPPSNRMEIFTAQKNLLDFSFERLDKLRQEMMISLSVLSGGFKLKQAEIVTKHVLDPSSLEKQLKELVNSCFLRYDIDREQYSIFSFTRRYLIALVETDFNKKEVYALARESFVNHFMFRLEKLYSQFLSKNSKEAIGEYRDEERYIKQLLSWCADKAIDDEKGKKVVDVINMAAPMIAKVTGRVEFERLFTMLAYRWRHDVNRYADSLVSIGMKVVLACTCSPRLCPRALGDAMTYLHVANQVQETFDIKEGNGRAQCLSKFGRCKVRLGYVDKGIKMLDEAIDIRCRQVEKDKTAILLAACCNDFAAACSYRNDYSRALEMSLERVLPTYQEHLGDHPYTASVLNSIGNYYEAIGDFENAIKYTEEALKMRMTLLGEHQETARSYYDLGVALKGKKLYEKALDNLQRAAEIQNKVLDTHEETVKSHQEKAIVLRILGRIKEADDAELLAKDIFKKLPKSTAKKSKSIRSLSESMDLPF